MVNEELVTIAVYKSDHLELVNLKNKKSLKKIADAVHEIMEERK